VWITGLALIGKAVGSKWPEWKKHLDIVDYIAVAVIVALIVWWLYRILRSRRAAKQAAA
jgi:membrane protein DedA with SNARE-associated domain